MLDPGAPRVRHGYRQRSRRHPAAVDKPWRRGRQRFMRTLALAFAVALALSAVAAPAGAQVTIDVDPTADAHPISPLIYGMNFPSDQQIGDARVAVGRWGGNSVTRYNYQTDVHNTAAD